jgi:hypothetical protein
MAGFHDFGGDVDEGNGMLLGPGHKPDAAATTRHLSHALRLACSQLQWDLARRITALIEAFSCSQPVPTDYPRDPREPRVRPRVHPDDDGNSSSSVTSQPFDAVSRGKSRDIAPRGPRAMSVPPAERADLASNELRDAAARWTRAVEDGEYGDLDDVAVSAIGPCGGVPAGSVSAEGTKLDVPTLLHLVEPLRLVCRSRQLTDLDDVEVLRRAFCGWDGSAVSALVDELVNRVESGAKIRSPFGLLVTLARRGKADLSGLSCVTYNGATGPGSVTTTAQGSQSAVSEPAELREDSRLERLRVLTGWVDIDAGRGCDEVPITAPVVRTRLEHLRGLLNRSTDAVLVDRLPTT